MTSLCISHGPGNFLPTTTMWIWSSNLVLQLKTCPQPVNLMWCLSGEGSHVPGHWTCRQRHGDACGIENSKCFVRTLSTTCHNFPHGNGVLLNFPNVICLKWGRSSWVNSSVNVWFSLADYRKPEGLVQEHVQISAQNRQTKRWEAFEVFRSQNTLRCCGTEDWLCTLRLLNLNLCRGGHMLSSRLVALSSAQTCIILRPSVVLLLISTQTCFVWILCEKCFLHKPCGDSPM